MAFFPWEASYSVGIAQIDEQHKKLFRLVNELNDAMQAGKAAEVIGGVFTALVEYTRTHFAAEERLMSAHAYPDIAGHKKQHEELTKQAEELAAKFKQTGIAPTIQVSAFLRDWLKNHILGTDKKYVPYLSSKGVR